MQTVAVIGCGNMGRALVRGFAESDAADEVIGVCSDESSRADCRAKFQSLSNVSCITPEGDLPPEVTNFVVAVKPNDVPGAISDWRGAIGRAGEDGLVISIAAGLPADSVRSELPDQTLLVRAMPNTPALVGAGVTGIWSQSEEAMDRAERLFRSVGEVVRLPSETDFDALTAVSGSGPAYVFMAIEALADGGVAEGLDRETATSLAVQTIRGAAELAVESGDHPGALKDAVTSPGGTTAAGLRSLEKSGFRSAWIEAVAAAAKQGREMGRDEPDGEKN